MGLGFRLLVIEVDVHHAKPFLSCPVRKSQQFTTFGFKRINGFRV